MMSCAHTLKLDRNIETDLSTHTVASSNSTGSDCFYGMLRGRISMYLPPKHPVIAS